MEIDWSLAGTHRCLSLLFSYGLSHLWALTTGHIYILKLCWNYKIQNVTYRKNRGQWWSVTRCRILLFTYWEIAIQLDCQQWLIWPHLYYQPSRCWGSPKRNQITQNELISYRFCANVPWHLSLKLSRYKTIMILQTLVNDIDLNMSSSLVKHLCSTTVFNRLRLQPKPT